MMILIRKIISCGKMLMLHALVVGLESSVFMKRLEIMQSLAPLPFDYPAKGCLSISFGLATETMLAVLVRHSIQMLLADVKVWIKPDRNKSMLFPNSAMVGMQGGAGRPADLLGLPAKIALAGICVCDVGFMQINL